MKPETWAIVGGRPDRVPGAPLNTPLVPASNFVLGTERLYSRTEATETWEAFEAVLGGLEGGRRSRSPPAWRRAPRCSASCRPARTSSSPTTATRASRASPRRARAITAGRVERLPAPDLAGWTAKALEADLLWLESPTNPLLDVADVAAICAAPRKPGTRVVVDNTFATPLLQQPLALGADVVIHSATKFLGGHSDLLMGAAVAKDAGAARAPDHGPQALRRHARHAGGVSGHARHPHAAGAPEDVDRDAPWSWRSGWRPIRRCTASATRASAPS